MKYETLGRKSAEVGFGQDIFQTIESLLVHLEYLTGILSSKMSIANMSSEDLEILSNAMEVLTDKEYHRLCRDINGKLLGELYIRRFRG